MKDYNRFNDLAEMLTTGIGRDYLMNNSSFREEFAKLQQMLKHRQKLTSIPNEAFKLSTHLCEQLESRKNTISQFRDTWNEKIVKLTLKYPYLSSLLQELSSYSYEEVYAVLSILTE
jgi:transketolase